MVLETGRALYLRWLERFSKVGDHTLENNLAEFQNMNFDSGFDFDEEVSEDGDMDS
jgi:hypothetical protein